MGWLNRRPGRYISVASLLLLCGCDQVRKALSEPEEARYELRQDKQGRTVRLNKVTGDVAIVNGTTSTPVELSDERSSPSVAKALPSALTSANATPQPRAARAAPLSALREPIDLSIRDLKLQQMPVYGSKVTITNPSPVFLTANQNQTPLRVIATGAVVRFLGTEGDWYHIEFDDPEWGRRVGFVGKKYVAVDRGQMQPVDLSVRAPKLNPMEPVDLSIRGLKLKQMEPVDLSIRKPKLKQIDPVDVDP